MEHIAGICDAIIVYDVLHKRKDCFGEGLEVFSLRTAINAFPDLLEQLFVSSDSCSSEDVLSILKFGENFEGDAEKSRVAGYFKNCIRKLGESGESGEGCGIALIGIDCIDFARNLPTYLLISFQISGPC